MCQGMPTGDTRLIDRPETILAQHVEECTGIHIDPDALRKFMCENWRTVQFLANRIHENDIRRKAVEQHNKEREKGPFLSDGRHYDSQGYCDNPGRGY